MKKLLAAILAVMMLLGMAPAMAETEGLSIRECHQFTLKKKDTTQSNKSVIRLWHIDTANDDVDAELMALAQQYADEIGPTLQKAGNATSRNSRLDVPIRASRTGLTWMSFLVQARITYHRDLIGQEFTSRTYNMETGERILLTDIFAQDSAGWDVLRQAVEDTVNAYFPDEAPNADALAAATTREALENTDFTLHGMSLVLHLSAGDFYPGRYTNIEVPLMYPDIRQYMTDDAQIETDNLAYYKTVALTYDDGPSRTPTTQVLNSLLECGARATFFVLGNLIEDGKDLVQREHDEGHSVGSHNWSHASVENLSDYEMRAIVPKVNNKMIDAIGIPTRYNRVPYGLYNQMIRAKVGWPLIQWSVDTYDWRGRSTNTIMNNIRKQFTDGDIVLLHDIKELTPETTTTLIRWLEEQGYILLTVDEIFAKDGVVLKPDVVYYRCDDGDTSIKIYD